MKQEHAHVRAGASPDPIGSWIDLVMEAQVRITSQDPDFPIEAALLDGMNHGGWRAAEPGPQTIWVDFGPSRPVEEVHLRFETHDRRTQEFVLSCSVDGGVTYRDLARQQFNFSPGTTREDETYRVHLTAVTDMKLMIIPDISRGPSRASLQRLRIR